MSPEDKEAERIRVLKRYDILDTPADGSLNRLTALASKIFNIPIAIISLVDTDRIWFASHYGLDANQIPRDPGLCDSAILSDEIYLVENAREDIRTLSNPLVASDFGLQFYAGYPLKTHDGYNLGTFCVIDKKQRYLTEQQKEILKEFASIAMDEIELRLSARKAAKQVNQILHETAEHLKTTSSEMRAIANSLAIEQLHVLANESRKTLEKVEELIIK